MTRVRCLVRRPRKRFFSFAGFWVLGVGVILGLIGCQNKEPPYVEKGVNELYHEAMDALQIGAFKKASRTFDEVERQHPYSPWAAKSMLMSAYANFQLMEHDKAIGSLESFIQLHPGHENVDYAYYMIALNHYEQISAVDHDQHMTEQSQKSLDEVIRRFPTSVYSRDARLKMALVKDHLAGKNLDVGRFYLKAGQVLSAINRFRKVIEKYHDTASVEEALYRLVECYSILGIKDQVRRAAAVLGHNYPGSHWYKEAYDLSLTYFPDLANKPIEAQSHEEKAVLKPGIPTG